MPTIAIADDHTLMREMLGRLCASMPETKVIATLDSGISCIEFFHQSKFLPDILLLDINLPVMDGVAVADYLADTFPEIRIIAVSLSDEPGLVEDMISVGAWGFISKTNLTSVRNAIELVLAGNVYIDSSIVHLQLKRAELVQRRIEEKLQRVEMNLTKREIAFISLSNSGMDYIKIASIMSIESKSVNNLFSSVAKKLNIKNRHELMLLALRIKLTKIARFAYHTN